MHSLAKVIKGMPFRRRPKVGKSLREKIMLKEIINDGDHVYRITVDECLMGNYYRFLISKRKLDSINTVIYERDWGEEVETYWSSEFFRELFTIGNPQDSKSKIESISEGQVYLAGKIDLLKSGPLEWYLGDGNNFSMIRIDFLIKDSIRKLYEDALIGGGNYAETDLK